MPEETQIQSTKSHPHVDAALISSADLTSHYNRRFDTFQEESHEYLQRIAGRRKALREHHVDLRELENFRQKVLLLQRQVSEVEVQIAKEKVRALRLEAEKQDFYIRQREFSDEVNRLMAAQSCQKRSQATSPLQQSLLPNSNQASISNGSGCLVRHVTFGGDEDAETPSKLWMKIEDEVRSLTREMDAFDAERSAQVESHMLDVSMLEAELQSELASLEGERESFADSLVAFVELRSQHLKLKQKHAEQVEVLESCNDELLKNIEDLSKKHRSKVCEVERNAKSDAFDHVEYRRVSEIIERQRAGAAKACLQDVRKVGEARATTLAQETKTLKERCASHRRRQKLTLDGLQADLSLVVKKLAVLDRVADEVHVALLQSCTGPDADIRPCVSKVDRPPSPYARPRREQQTRCRPGNKSVPKFESKVTVRGTDNINRKR